MTATLASRSAVTAPTQFVMIDGRRIAYRSLGDGPPLILCNRFRGVLDVWDPAFLDALAENFRVITFDFSGLGQSTGRATYERKALAKDAKDLADALDLERFVIGGWSLGGMAAQVVAARYTERVTHMILIGTTSPGKVNHPPEPIFMQTALKPDNDLEDEIILFFEPKSAASRAAAQRSHDRIAQRTTDLSPPIPEETYLRMLAETRHEDLFHDDGGYRDFLKSTSIPILVISGDHEIVFPVENWFDLNRECQSVHLVVFPQMGHGPHHEAPQMCADLIASFVRNRTRN
ncbi:MAG: alpha/beta hydrolase [Candidatus Competibacter sp.]|nr:alpha/beta hydrolase [Candidatus Competibacter sp.]